MIDASLKWALVAAVPAVASEYLYKKLTGPWESYLHVWLPLSLLISYAICQLVRAPGTTLLDALIVWTLCVMGLRILATMALGDTVQTGTWVALVLMLTARYVQAYWGR